MKGKGKAKEICESPEEIITRLMEELQAKSLVCFSSAAHFVRGLTILPAPEEARRCVASSPADHDMSSMFRLAPQTLRSFSLWPRRLSRLPLAVVYKPPRRWWNASCP